VLARLEDSLLTDVSESLSRAKAPTPEVKPNDKGKKNDLSSIDFDRLSHHASSTTRTIGSEHYHGTMKKEHPDWNFCPTCNASLAIESRSDVLGLLLTNPENRFVISASLSTEAGTGILSPFSLNGDTKIPVWAEASQLGSPGLTKERLFEEVIVQHVLPAFRNGFKLAKYSGPEEDIHLFLQILIKYAQKDLSDRALNLDRSLSDESRKTLVQDLTVARPGPPQNDMAGSAQKTQKKSLRIHYSPDDDPNREVTRSENQVSSGVIGLDKILGGGLPKNKITLVSGHSGTGKTILGAQFLIEGAKKGEIGILALVGQMPPDVLEELETIGLPILSLVSQHKLVLIVSDERKVFRSRSADIINVKGKSQLLSAIEKIVWRKKASRLVIDSFTALINTQDRRGVRSSITEIFERLSELKCTKLLTGELQSASQEVSYFGIEDTFASGVIILRSKNIAERHTRYLHIPKMKGSNHNLSEYVISIDNTIGLKVLEPLKTYSERLEPKLPGRQGGNMGLTELTNLFKILTSLNPSFGQSRPIYNFGTNKVGDEQENEEDVRSYAWQSAASYISKAKNQNKKIPHLKLGTMSNQPKSLSIEDAKLTSAANENPWASIISSREKEDNNAPESASPNPEIQSSSSGQGTLSTLEASPEPVDNGKPNPQ
jgi:KaiC/GvpD/RAD55 family RecA-like ATPase